MNRYVKSSDIPKHRNLSLQFLRLVYELGLLIQPFFLCTFVPHDLCHLVNLPYLPPVLPAIDTSPLLMTSRPLDSVPINSNRYWSLALFSHVPHPVHLPSAPKFWSHFWSLPLHHIAHNIWFRILHRTLPFASKHHSFSPSFFTTDKCSICSPNDTDTDALDHFIYNCPEKYKIWSSLWPSYFSSPCSPSAIHNALFKLIFPPTLDSVLLPSATIIGCILRSVWHSHWDSFFDKVPSHVPSVIVTANSLIRRSYQECLFSRQLSPFPLPHLSDFPDQPGTSAITPQDTLY